MVHAMTISSLFDLRSTAETMPKPVAMSKFLPSLVIPESDRKLLQELATTLVDQNLDQYNNFCVTKDGHPDNRLWVATKKVEGFRMYRERPSESPPAISSLLLLGSVVGKLEDLMYGVVTPTDECLKLKSACTRDGIVDGKVLEELVGPTTDDPFHHVNLQWRLYDDRDFVTLDTTGIMQTSWGECIGYNVSHSVGFRQLPAFTDLGVSRGNMSVCSLYRQKANNTVECYTRGFFDLSTGTHGTVLQTITTQWLSFSRNMEYAQMKKLMWHLRKNSEDAVRLKRKSVDSACRLCAKNFSFLPGRKKSCKSCNYAVCPRCCVKKLVRVVAPDQCSILEKIHTFCSRCVHEAVECDAAAIAREELAILRHDSEPVQYKY